MSTSSINRISCIWILNRIKIGLFAALFVRFEIARSTLEASLSLSATRSCRRRDHCQQSFLMSTSLIVWYVAVGDAASGHEPGRHEPHQHRLRWDLSSYKNVFFYCFLDLNICALICYYRPWFVILGLRYEYLCLWFAILGLDLLF